MRKWMPAVPIAAAYTLSLMVWPELPDAVIPDWRAVLPWAAGTAEPMPRAAVALLFPTVALVVWGALSVGARIRGRMFEDAIGRFAPTYAAVATWVVSLLFLLHALIISTVVRAPSLAPQVLGGLFGVGLIAVGNVMPRLRPNRVAGLRTAAALSDEREWLKLHRWYGIMLMAHGAIVVGLALAAPRYAFPATAISLVSAALIAQAVTRRSAAAAH
jgi:uncharacterized membrane protein